MRRRRTGGPPVPTFENWDRERTSPNLRKRPLLLIVGAVIRIPCFAFSLCVLLAAGPALRAEPVPPTPAPAWKLKDLDGNVVSSDQFKGKVVVIDFWATWCPPCRAEIPGYVMLQQKYAKDGLVIVGVSVDQDPAAKVKKWVDGHKVTYTIVMQDDDVTTAFGGMDAIPTTFLIDRDGNIRDKKVGEEPTADYEKKILKYLNPPAGN
jgi:thiol-disulfide isomerase/thioredoxin